MHTHDASLLALLGLGAYHGLNPGMGWLFAVALGMQEGSRRALWRTLAPLALGHAFAVAAALAVAGAVGAMIPLGALRWITAATLVGFGVYKLASTRHPRWGSMRIGFGALTFWSFLMASAHGAGLMLLPLVMRDLGGAGAGSMGGHAAHGTFAASPAAAHTMATFGIAATAVHTAGYLAVTGLAAALVYEKFGVGFIRRGWYNVDLAWAAALLVAGVVTVTI